MYQPRLNCFRQDLVVVADTSSAGSSQRYLVKNPASGEIFEFGPEEIYLCRLMNGELAATEIISRFEERFKYRLKLLDFDSFANFLARAGLLELYQEQGEHSVATAENESAEAQSTDSDSDNLLGDFPGDSNYSENSENMDEPVPYRLIFFNPNPLFKSLAVVFKPIIFLQIWFLFPILVLAALTLLYNFDNFWFDLNYFGKTFPLIASISLGLLAVNLGSKLFQGTAIASYGGTVNEFGIELAFGLVPLFFISKKGARRLNRKAKLGIFSSPITFRLSLFSICILTWFSNRSTQSGLVTLALIFSQSTLIGLLIDSSPFWKSNGYLWLTTYFNIYRLYERAIQLGEMTLSRRPLPSNLLLKDKLFLWIYVIIFVLLVAAISIALAIPIATSLENRFQGTGIVLFALLLMPILRWYFTMNFPNNNIKGLETTSAILEAPTPELRDRDRRPPITYSLQKFVDRHKFTIFGVVSLAIVSALPYQYHPGGQITLLPPYQQEIQANISGKIVKVFTNGGDGVWLKKNSIIAQVEPSRQLNPATPIQDDVSIISEQIKQLEANLQKQNAKLSELLSTPRKDEVDVARAQLGESEAALEGEKRKYEILQEELEIARQQLKVAQREVEVAEKALVVEVTSTAFREKDSARQKQLSDEGVISLQRYEDAERQAAVGRDRIVELNKTIEVRQQEVVTQERNIIARGKELQEQNQNIRAREQDLEEKRANLNLILSGPHPDEIQATRHEVEAAQAQLQEKVEELKSTDKQLQRNDLLMPFDGRIVTPFLAQKINTYIEQGNQFAIAEDDRNIRGEMQIAETDVGQFDIGKTVSIKLWTYPNQTMEGRVISIEPKTVEEQNSRFVNVIVELPNLDRLLKSGMTGHAKVEGETMPAIVVFTRPLVRFFQIEVWSWIP